MKQNNTIYKGDAHQSGDSRREFLKKVASLGALSFVGSNVFSNMLTATPTTAFPPRTRQPNPYVTDDGKPLLVDVIGNDFESMLTAGLEAIGGLNKLTANAQSILIKPNLNLDFP